MTSAVKRSYPFGSRPTSLVEDSNQFQVTQVLPSHKKMSVTSPNVNMSVEKHKYSSSSSSSPSPSSWKHSKTIEAQTMTTTTKNRIVNDNNESNDNRNNNHNGNDNSNDSVNGSINGSKNNNIGDKSPLPSPPSAKGRKNMKNLQLVVPPVRSSISAPSSPQLPPNNPTCSAYSHNRRPSTPLCFYQNKDVANSNVADPMALMSKTENAIGEELPYKEEPILILDNLYLGSELNAANRPMLNRLEIEFILNVGKEVENPYLDEIVKTKAASTCANGTIDHQHFSLLVSQNSPVTSDDNHKTIMQSPSSQFHHEPASFASVSPIGLLRSNSNSLKKKPKCSSSSSSSPPSSPSSLIQSTQNAMFSGIPLIVPGTSEYKQIKYKKFFWTHNQENLISDFNSAFAFIDEARSIGKNILVHCQCGVSRSASLIIGYVMRTNNMNLNQAYEFVKDKSPYISPNMSLVYQLVDFEKTLNFNINNDNYGDIGDHIGSDIGSNVGGCDSVDNSLPSTPTKNRAESVKSHSRQSSIESDLLLKSHRRSSSIPRTQINNNNNNNIYFTSSFNTTTIITGSNININTININDLPPKTPLIPPSSEGLLSIQPHQATVKGNGSGRFHVITASLSPTSPSALSPASSLSPTSSTSPTTPSSELSSPSPTTNISKSRRSSHLSPLSSACSSRYSSRPYSSSSLSSYSSMDCNQLTPHESLNPPLSPTFPLNKSPSFTDLSSTILATNNTNNNDTTTTTTTISTTIDTIGSFTSHDDPNTSQSNVSLRSSYSKTYSKLADSSNVKNDIKKNDNRQYHHHHVNNKDHEVLSARPSGKFSKSTLDSIFSPTRTSPPITPVTITNFHDLLVDDD